MNSYIIMSKERSSYEKFSDMIRKNEPESHIMRVRDSSEAYMVARDYNQPVCMIDIESFTTAGNFSGGHSPEDDVRVARERLGELKRYIDLNLGARLTLEDLAKKMFITPNYLSSLFKQYEQIPLIRYIENTRMKKAKFLLETEPNKPVRDIGLEVGYRSNAYFSRTFKKHYGITPLRYRKKLNR